MTDGRWKRPESAPHPSVWRRVVGRKPVDGKVPSFVIQDVPQEREEDVLAFMVENYLPNEPVVKNASFSEDRASVEEVLQVWKKMMGQQVAVAAFLEGDGPRPRIAGANILGVNSRADQGRITQQFQGEAMNKIVGMKKHLYSGIDLFQKFGVQEYMSALGLSVAKVFYGQGLGTQLLRARHDIGRAVGLKLSVTYFSSTEAQVLAIREGWEVISHLDYVDHRVDGQEVFPGVASPCAILMAKWL